MDSLPPGCARELQSVESLRRGPVGDAFFGGIQSSPHPQAGLHYDNWLDQKRGRSTCRTRARARANRDTPWSAAAPPCCCCSPAPGQARIITALLSMSAACNVDVQEDAAVYFVWAYKDDQDRYRMDDGAAGHG
jgi:hypothetical protein